MKRLAFILIACAILLSACGGSHHALLSLRATPSINDGSASTPTVGEVLTTTTGTWTNSPTGFAYQWQRCTTSCMNIASATASSYTVQTADVGDTIDVIVTASNAGGSASQTSAPTGVVTSSGSLPSGVTLQAIDGGSCSSSTGPCSDNYYCSNSFTYACNAGWDSTSFLPIIQDYAFYAGNSATSFKALGLNSTVRVTGGTNMTTLNSDGVWAIAAADSATNFGTETVGAHIEEPSAGPPLRAVRHLRIVSLERREGFSSFRLLGISFITATSAVVPVAAREQ